MCEVRRFKSALHSLCLRKRSIISKNRVSVGITQQVYVWWCLSGMKFCLNVTFYLCWMCFTASLKSIVRWNLGQVPLICFLSVCGGEKWIEWFLTLQNISNIIPLISFDFTKQGFDFLKQFSWNSEVCLVLLLWTL